MTTQNGFRAAVRSSWSIACRCMFGGNISGMSDEVSSSDKSGFVSDRVETQSRLL